MTVDYPSDVTGADSELVNRLIALIDQAPDFEPLWWADYGVLAAVNVAGSAPTTYDEVDRARFIAELRDRIEYLVYAGAAEDFLVRALRREIDDFARRRGDVGIRNQQAQRMRDHLARVMTDHTARQVWREAMAERSPEFAEMTDKQVIDAARDLHDSSPATSAASAEDTATAWASSEAWLKGSDAMLGDPIIDRWRHLSIQRQLID